MTFSVRTILSLILVTQILMVYATSCLAQPKKSAEICPHWIWHEQASNIEQSSTVSQRYVFEKTFEVTAPVRSAKLRLAADFCHATLSSNGKLLATIEAFSPTVDIDVTDSIKLGSNVLHVEAQAVPGPPAIALSLQIYSASEVDIAMVVTDESWSVKQFAAAHSTSKQIHARSLGTVSAALWGFGRRSSSVDAIENYEQWQQAKAGNTLAENKFWTVPDFEVSLLRSALPDEGSWVSMAFDPKGRLTIAKEERGLLRLTLDPSSRSVTKVDAMNDSLLECRGMVYAHDSLYVNANNSKGMYRLRDSDGDDQLDEIDLLRAFPGSVGHGRNDLALGPDGWIYSIHGDSVDIPSGQIIDRTSPLRDARRGQVSREGHVVRTDPEGKNWELLCAGLRNPFGIASNPDGEWFTYDADAEFDMGTPWYRPTRIVHLVSGGDYGWRGVTGKWPPYYADHPDNAMPTLDIGKGSPTAVLFGTAAAFPVEYRESLFVLDWTYGRILAIHLAPRGAGYRAQAETFLQGRPLNVTDLAIGPDGAMYIITGGRKTQSALYRIAYSGTSLGADAKSKHELDAIADAEFSRQLRKKLEQGHVGNHQLNDLAWRHLDSADWTIRHAARVAIEHQPLEAWRAQALSEKRPRAAIEAILALARSGDTAIVPAAVDRLLSLPTKDLQLSEFSGMLHAYESFHDTAPDALQSKRIAIIRQIESHLSDLQAGSWKICRSETSPRVLGTAALLLAKLQAESAVAIASHSLLSSSVQEEQLQGLFALRNTKSGWTNDSRQTYFRVLNDASRFVSGEGMPKFLGKIREEAIATLTDDERNQLADLIDPAALAAEPLPPPRPTVKQWTIDELFALVANDKRKPDAVRGAIVFRDALCSRCHRSGARGPAVGPDLTHVASRFSRRDIIESIVLPSKVVAENYRSVQITTADGRVVVGRVMIEGDYRSEKLQIATDSLRPTEIVELHKKDIENLRESPISPMPAGLLDTFQPDEIIDLLEYLIAGQISLPSSK